MRPVPERDLPPGIRSAGSLAAEVMDGLRKPRTPSPTAFTPSDLSVLDAPTRPTLPSLAPRLQYRASSRTVRSD